MTKKDLIDAVCQANPGTGRTTVEQAVHLFFDIITFYLAHHQRVELRGFGVFSVRHRKKHMAHNPQTGEILEVPEKFVPFFKPSLALKEILKENAKGEKLIESGKRSGFFSFFYRS